MSKSKKNTAKMSTIDQTARFEKNAVAEISTDKGWVKATVTDVTQIAEGVLYHVHYVPTWDTTGKGGFTVVTGAAIR